MSDQTPTFADLGVPDSICDALARRDIHKPFDIQSATMVDALAGRDVLGRAPTGSGKTLAFGIPAVVGLGKAEPRRPLVLILSPTRELADQIKDELQSFSKPVRVGVVYGGVGYGKQLGMLRKGVEVLVACPGRLEDLIERGDVNLSDVERVVLDEADRMADMGFVPAVRRILNQTRSDRQTVLFSATLDGDVAKLTRDYQHDPVRHEIGESTPDITLADHLFWKMDRSERTEVTATAVGAEWPAIVFCRTRHGCDRLTKQLAKLGIDAVAIHGGRSQNQRTRALDDFATSRAQALIATDVAARGIHVDGVALVVHYDPPEDHKAYVHRSGRTARAGASGVVLSLLTPDAIKATRKMMRKIDLDEPITGPDVELLRDVASGAPKPERAPARREDHAPRRQGPKNRNHGRNANKNRNNTRGKHGGNSRNGSKNRSNSRYNDDRYSDDRQRDDRHRDDRNDSRNGGDSRRSDSRNGDDNRRSDSRNDGDNRRSDGRPGGGRNKPRRKNSSRSSGPQRANSGGPKNRGSKGSGANSSGPKSSGSKGRGGSSRNGGGRSRPQKATSR